MVFNTLGSVSGVLAGLLLLPALVSVCYGEKCVWAFLITAALSLLLYGAGFSRERGRSLLMALSLGVLWQVVTLTSFGARLVAAIDHIFCSEKREVKS